MKTEAEAARAADMALLLTRGPGTRTNFAYATGEFFADAALRDAEGALGRLHTDYYAQAYRVARRWQEDDVETELRVRRGMEAAGGGGGGGGAGGGAGAGGVARADRPPRLRQGWLASWRQEEASAWVSVAVAFIVVVVVVVVVVGCSCWGHRFPR
jgi:hypothetical protein